MSFLIRALTAQDRALVRDFFKEYWGATRMVSRSGLHEVDEHPGFIALAEERPVGLATYIIQEGECEVFTLHSTVEGMGIGTALLDAVKGKAIAAHCHRLWLNTTNDKLHALRFYQRWGLVLSGLYPNILSEWRKLKPEIPERGREGIPLRDALELEMRL